MKYNPDIHHRRSIRLKGYDYTQAGAYFITMCVKDRACLFGQIENSVMNINEFGDMVIDVWQWLPEQYPYVSICEFIIMPNHFHCILIIDDACRGGSRTALTRTALTQTVRDIPNNTHEGGSRTAPTDKRKSVGRLIGVFKTVSTKRINEKRLTPGNKLWQRNYYEHIIHNDAEYQRIADYIVNNPTTWKDDKLWTE